MLPRPIRIVGDVAFVPLTQGYEAIIDSADVPLVAKNNWQVWRSPAGNLYAARKERKNGGKKTIRMHHMFLPLVDGLEIDHRNGNGLDNRRCNIRRVTRSENALNRQRPREGKPYFGVHFDARSGRYVARIILGRFKTRADAAEALEPAKVYFTNKKRAA